MAMACCNTEVNRVKTRVTRKEAYFFKHICIVSNNNYEQMKSRTKIVKINCKIKTVPSHTWNTSRSSSSSLASGPMISQRKALRGLKSRSFVLWGNSTKHCAAMLPIYPVLVKMKNSEMCYRLINIVISKLWVWPCSVFQDLYKCPCLHHGIGSCAYPCWWRYTVVLWICCQGSGVTLLVVEYWWKVLQSRGLCLGLNWRRILVVLIVFSLFLWGTE